MPKNAANRVRWQNRQKLPLAKYKQLLCAIVARSRHPGEPAVPMRLGIRDQVLLTNHPGQQRLDDAGTNEVRAGEVDDFHQVRFV